jgi:hypothetical protein
MIAWPSARAGLSTVRYAVAVQESDVKGGGSAPVPDYSEDGVDLTLIRWTLSLTPLQRLQFLEDRINGILAIREMNARK